ncbi:diguanylate cyclase domain-containing protein [Ectopseudomonas khazarica]|uniref:diguanylate cyclase n=1 Tax=Ectopseudomonas khazarica TaxID=2502979 RepID=A0ABW7MJH7_9GAMM
MSVVTAFADRRPKILVVDDQPVNVMILHEMLRPYYDVYMATKGNEVTTVAIKTQPDLILLDIVLNDINGYEVCSRLKADKSTKDIPVIFISAKAEDEDEATGLKVGAVDYIRKPFNTAIALSRIETHITLKLQADRLRDLANLDGLTGVHNRRAFDEMLSRYLDQSRREKQQLSLLMLDVDFFKRFNDHYGHLEGDECLKRVSKALEASSRRPFDFVARYGGEEFACVLPNTSSSGARQLAEVIRSSVEQLNIPHAQSSASKWVSVSVGVASNDPSHETTPESLLKKADEALYRAKNNGRNQVSS